jgi:hypothetical protein
MNLSIADLEKRRSLGENTSCLATGTSAVSCPVLGTGVGVLDLHYAASFKERVLLEPTLIVLKVSRMNQQLHRASCRGFQKKPLQYL